MVPHTYCGKGVCLLTGIMVSAHHGGLLEEDKDEERSHLPCVFVLLGCWLHCLGGGCCGEEIRTNQS